MPELCEISLTIPVYNSADIVDELVRVIDEHVGRIGVSYEIVLVNDASPDGRTWQAIERVCKTHAHVVGVNHRKNFGQDAAIMTALRHARGRFAVIMDDDLQHHPKYVSALYAEIVKTKVDVVYGKYDHKKQALWKNVGSWLNGKLAEQVIGKPKGVYLSPYKILSRELYGAILEYTGPYPYVDGLLYQVTNRFGHVRVEHQKRFAGSSNFSFIKSVAIFTRLAVSFSVKPMRLFSIFGFAVSGLSLLASLFFVIYRLAMPEDFPVAAMGWSSLITSLYFIGGVLLMCMGMIGEYVGRTHLIVNRAPQSFCAERLNFESPKRK